ncbi:hypothetical protein NIES4071_06760 [Calothrix sp. NIES-4071]|nr:hypothetical protein NIES4071_06760 [Calothrix sp. NIES-4071]BAZ55018.1 hypothetical protein NIES4105_06720 [Calothrix sp. NIES-4105]
MSRLYTMVQNIYRWAATGVSSYPLTHPIVGQGDFYQKFRHFIHLVDQENEAFAHVFAIIAQWGVGKSRLGYELISQINDTSPGWTVRNTTGSLIDAKLFDNEADREQYLGLYIRYSQIANEYHNVDNWFGYGLYKALLPLAQSTFDSSIQGSITKEAYDRLIVKGFEESKLAQALEINKNYSDEILYEDPYLVTNLCQAAYDYLSQFGIKYILIALDELETVAEAATYGLESDQIKHLDGRAIKLLGKAIKEEDPRRKLPWLRYIALCSPAIGDELREIQSTARRFELVELAQNAFADVSDFVQALQQEGRLSEDYLEGLVEAAYAMSGANFGWFNVIMANIDEIFRNRRTRGETQAPTVVELFDQAVQVSGRISQYILDHNAIQELKIDRAYLPAAKSLLYGQLPVALNKFPSDELNALLAAVNEYDESIALRYRSVEWDDLECSKALREAKFIRDKDTWRISAVDQPLNLKQLLANLSTYAIHENRSKQSNSGKHTLLIPLRKQDFEQLVNLLYPHPAAQDAARALWRHFIGKEIGEQDLDDSQATYIGPSIAMLGRLNLRYRKQSQNSLIFRDPDFNSAHELIIKQLQKQSASEKAIQILTGIMRLLDQNWSYNPVDTGLKDITAIATNSGRDGGLVTCNALKLHPQGRLIMAWVNNIQELEVLCRQVSNQFGKEGRTPVLAFTSSRALIDLFANPSPDLLKNAHTYLLLYQLSDSEEFVLHQIGIPTSLCTSFKINGQGFTTSFSNRTNSLLRPLLETIHNWRRKLSNEGLIAFSFRPDGKLKEDEKQLLFKAWRYLITSDNSTSLSSLDTSSGVNVQELVDIFKKLEVTANAKRAGYESYERALLFDTLDDTANSVFPPFLVKIIDRLLEFNDWTFEAAKREWFWGYIWEGAKANDIFIEWMALACELEFAKIEHTNPNNKTKKYIFKNCSELDNLIREADNWLRNDYPKIVQDMEVVFGEGKVQAFFAPLNSIPVGTKTVIARSAIDEAKNSLAAIKIAEETQYAATNIENKHNILIEAAKHRLSLLNNIGSVYLRDEYNRIQSDENVKTLNFEDDKKPLWERIRRAELFAKTVHEFGEGVCNRIDSLQEEMKQEVENLNYFPISLFTLSLEKIRDIINVIISSNTNPQSTTGREQVSEAKTLYQYLRDLKVADATDKLAQLGREVGIELNSSKQASLAEINGTIVNAFLRLKQAYEKLTDQLKDKKSRLSKLQSILNNSPDNFNYPVDTPILTKLLNQPDYIEDALADIKDNEAERLRNVSMYDKAAKGGNFKPLMDESLNLLTEPTRSLNVLAGHVLSLENAVTGYYKHLLQDSQLESITKGLNALLKIRKQTLVSPLTLAELEATGSLNQAVSLKEQRCQEWQQIAESLLSPTKIPFERWQRIVMEIDSGKNPTLNPEEAAKLVTQGFIVNTYKLGG